jgi:mono/diheme cytochrome c family protein
LLDAWGFPIRPADLQAPHLKSGDSPRDVYRTVATGLNGTPMIGFAELLTPEEIWELVAFLNR